jgi:hypothetical protein
MERMTETRATSTARRSTTRRVCIVSEGNRILRIVDDLAMSDAEIEQWLDGMAAAGIPVEREGRNA